MLFGGWGQPDRRAHERRESPPTGPVRSRVWHAVLPGGSGLSSTPGRPPRGEERPVRPHLTHRQGLCTSSWGRPASPPRTSTGLLRTGASSQVPVLTPWARGKGRLVAELEASARGEGCPRKPSLLGSAHGGRAPAVGNSEHGEQKSESPCRRRLRLTRGPTPAPSCAGSSATG